MINLNAWSQETTGFLPTARLGFPPREKGGEQFVELLAIDPGQDIAIGHLAGHLPVAKPKAL
ncbi:hypothetical protein KSC_019220 [Ktedonobacter sp. SOSP1-52]|nr:hypothetical protein KSC_019220 [Ktedonobacter sp. SOSP1-52]